MGPKVVHKKSNKRLNPMSTNHHMTHESYAIINIASQDVSIQKRALEHLETVGVVDPTSTRNRFRYPQSVVNPEAKPSLFVGNPNLNLNLQDPTPRFFATKKLL